MTEEEKKKKYKSGSAVGAIESLASSVGDYYDRLSRDTALGNSAKNFAEFGDQSFKDSGKSFDAGNNAKGVGQLTKGVVQGAIGGVVAPPLAVVEDVGRGAIGGIADFGSGLFGIKDAPVNGSTQRNKPAPTPSIDKSAIPSLKKPGQDGISSMDPVSDGKTTPASPSSDAPNNGITRVGNTFSGDFSKSTNIPSIGYMTTPEALMRTGIDRYGEKAAYAEQQMKASDMQRLRELQEFARRKAETGGFTNRENRAFTAASGIGQNLIGAPNDSRQALLDSVKMQSEENLASNNQQKDMINQRIEAEKQRRLAMSDGVSLSKGIVDLEQSKMMNEAQNRLNTQSITSGDYKLIEAKRRLENPELYRDKVKYNTVKGDGMSEGYIVSETGIGAGGLPIVMTLPEVQKRNSDADRLVRANELQAKYPNKSKEEIFKMLEDKK